MTSIRNPRHILAALFLASLAACNTGPASVTPAPATTSVPSDRQLLATYSRMNDRYLALWTRGGGTRTASAHTRTIMGFPHLVLEARGRGAKPDFYVYLPSPDGGQTQEFGAFFDRNGDGRIDWLVFNGGTLLAAGPTIAWWTHHVIDRNGDGRFDVFVVDAVDRNGDGLIEPGSTAWLYDDDFDGRLDRGAVVADGRATPMAETGGRLDWKRMSGLPMPKVGEPFLDLFNVIAGDIETLL